MSLILPALTICVAGATLVYLWRQKWGRPSTFLPPGPHRDPLIGNLRQMPSDKVPLIFHEWAKTYGDVMYLKVPGQAIVVLDSLRAAEDLLEKRSAIYSDRPKFPVYELFGWTCTLTMMPYGKKFSQYRQMHHSYLNREKCADYKPMQLVEARTLANNLLTLPWDQYENALSRFATGVITQIVAGHRIESEDDIYLRMSKMVLESLARAAQVPAGTAIDFFPFLEHFPSWFPGTRYAQMAREWRPTVRELHTFPVETVKKQREEGVATPSFILTHLDAVGTSSMTEEYEQDLQGNAAAMFTAVPVVSNLKETEKTWGVLSVFLLAMVLYPDCQRKAQQEIESVIGASRLPEFEDRAKLPYVECIYEELFRWNPGVPLGRMVPDLSCIIFNSPRQRYHTGACKTTHTAGCLYPQAPLSSPISVHKLTFRRGMTLDPEIYSNPTEFVPERYLPQPIGMGEPHFSGKFGFGRRICTGQYLAANSVWIAVATILATCRITNAIDEKGEIIVPENAMTYGLMRYCIKFAFVLLLTRPDSHPVDFRCAIEPRTPQSKSLVMEGLHAEAEY
ncbi:cytochrome P450 [Mycena maculata]|uniref:Cytochrome P450 n=1 Tax=Mycena maculata TaxID=230809 RepID=A0AAD7J2Y7_9AGAR|nr:cytochrome P450 [Mycena maculata]